MKTATLLSAAVGMLAQVGQAMLGPDLTTVKWWGNLFRDTQLDDFELGYTPYNARRVHGVNQTWADIVNITDIPTTMFDYLHAKDFKLSITDDSIYAPPDDVPQTGLRRSELVPDPNPDELWEGVTTFHFSVMKDPEHPLNKTHEYQLVFVEDDDFHLFHLQYGTPYKNVDGPVDDDPNADSLRLIATRPADYNGRLVLFETPFTPDLYHNFAVTIDFEQKTLRAYYSTGIDEMQPVVPATEIATGAGGGDLHFGIVKFPVGATTNILTEGIQESGIRESIIFGGIFAEDSSKGGVSTTSVQAEFKKKNEGNNATNCHA